MAVRVNPDGSITIGIIPEAPKAAETEKPVSAPQEKPVKKPVRKTVKK